MKYFVFMIFFATIGRAQESDSIEVIHKNEMEIADSILVSNDYRSYRQQEENLYAEAYAILFSIPRLEYTYFGGSHLSLGIKLNEGAFFRGKDKMSPIFVGALFHFAYLNDRFSFVPEIDTRFSYMLLNHNYEWYNSFGVGVGVSPHYYSPKIYTNMLFFNLEFGYNFQFNKPENFDYEGFRFSIGWDFL